MDELCGINLSEPRIELEREIMRAVRGVLREYSKNSGNQMFNRKEKAWKKYLSMEVQEQLDLMKYRLFP